MLSQPARKAFEQREFALELKSSQPPGKPRVRNTKRWNGASTISRVGLHPAYVLSQAWNRESAITLHINFLWPEKKVDVPRLVF